MKTKNMKKKPTQLKIQSSTLSAKADPEGIEIKCRCLSMMDQITNQKQKVLLNRILIPLHPYHLDRFNFSFVKEKR